MEKYNSKIQINIKFLILTLMYLKRKINKIKIILSELLNIMINLVKIEQYLYQLKIEILEKIDNEINLLRKHELSKIKDYLRDRGLIKIGSNAPENVLRETYENAYLCGNINNNNKDVMLHNYLNGETK